MKAVAVFPGKPNSIHLADLSEPKVDDILGGRGDLVEVLRVSVDGTDKEINGAEYGEAPVGYEFLVIGHESFGRVLEVGPNVRGLEPGDAHPAASGLRGHDAGSHRATNVQQRAVRGSGGTVHEYA